MKKQIIFAYTSPENKQMIADIAKENNDRISNVVTKILDGYRTGKKPKFEKLTPKYVKHAENWKSKHA